MESLEGLDGDFLGKVYQRHRGEPWLILETERLVVREMEEGDLEALYRIYDKRDAADFLDGLSADRDEAVSYTHLDVYKRQICCRQSLNALSCFCLARDRTWSKKEQA